MEFLILLLPVRSLVVYIKYVFRVYLDSVRRAMAAGERRTARAAPLIRVIARTDTKYLTVIFQFAITMIVPIGVDIIGRLIMLGLGVLIISLVSAYRYMMRE